MPILDRPQADSPLTQGDLLKGVTLYVASAAGDSPQKVVGNKVGHCCLVVSRPCVAAHKSEIIVAHVDGYRESRPKDKIETLEDACDFLEQLRDGKATPDRLYLGHIPELGDGRYCAHLDSLHTVRLPPEDRVQQFLKDHRITRLSEQFARDLHVRLFTAFASLGFDDYGWYSTDDLNWIVLLGKKELADLEAKLAECQAAGFEKQQQRTEMSKQIEKIRATLSPYLREMESRTGAG